jgi:hypothetical protein
VDLPWETAPPLGQAQISPVIKSTKGFCDHHNSFRMVTALVMLMYAALRI